MSMASDLVKFDLEAARPASIGVGRTLLWDFWTALSESYYMNSKDFLFQSKLCNWYKFKPVVPISAK